MNQVFICYRNDDNAYATDHIYRCLIREFGEQNIFRDKEKIVPGAKFANYIQKASIGCKTMLVIIGREWLKLFNCQEGK